MAVSQSAFRAQTIIMANIPQLRAVLKGILWDFGSEALYLLLQS